MNDKEKQIEEIVRFIDTHIMAKKIAELIPSKIVSYDGRSKGQHLYIEQKMEIAKEMMKKGVVVLTKNEHAKLVSQVRQEFEHEYKDKVVLSREEFDKLGLVVETVQKYESDEKGQPILVEEQKIVKKLRTDFTELLNQEIRELQLAQTRKETAREILKELIKNCQYTFNNVGKPIIALSGDFALNIAKQYGVEIGEEV